MTNKVENIFSLDGRKAFISGAYGHLGESMSEVLAEAGAHVYLNGRNLKKLKKICKKFKDAGLSVEIACFDITDERNLKKFFSSINKLDIIVNNAYSGGLGDIDHSSSEDFRNSYEVSVVAANNIFKHSLKFLKKSNCASVINIASMYGMVSPDHKIYPDKKTTNSPFYGASKAALIQWTKYAACQYGKEGIRVNSISPGPFPNMISSNQLSKALKNKSPLSKLGTPEELKGPILFLASNASSYVNGANLVVDGGWTSS